MQRIATPSKGSNFSGQGTDAGRYVCEMATLASWARSVDTWLLAADKWNLKPDPINGTFSDRSKKGSQELLSDFLHGNEDLRDSEIDNERLER